MALADPLGGPHANPLASWRALTIQERRKAALLSVWFFLTIATLWVLKPIRSASLLAHLGAAELPYVRFATVVVVGPSSQTTPGSSTASLA